MRRALAEISPAEEATCTEASWMSSAIFRRWTTISSRLRPRVPTSSSPPATIWTVRSPLATASEAWAIVCSGRSHRPERAQPAAEPTATRTSPRSRASKKRRCRSSPSAAWLIATSTPPFTASGRGETPPPRSSDAAPPPPVVTGARNSSTGSPSVVVASISSRSSGGPAGSFRMPLPTSARTSPLASRIIAPTTSEPPGAAPADVAPSRNCRRSGRSSVRTPYLALKARLLAM
jgi:hypothetical protein